MLNVESTPMSDQMIEAVLPEFEASVKMNGECYWSAREFSEMLGYATFKSFRVVLDRATRVCMSLTIPVAENFRQTIVVVEGSEVDDIKLTRFACYLVAMNADSRKPQVARAQAYLSYLSQAISEYVQAAQEVDRLVIRGDLGDEEKSLAATAKMHGVENYAYFHNAGYRGMYNMTLNQLRMLKRVPNTRSPLDFMYSEELAANLFRITQTNAKIRNEALSGQIRLESAAHEVGRTVRRTMKELSGTLPEKLPAAGDIKAVKAGLRAAQRTLRKLDGPPPRSPSV